MIIGLKMWPLECTQDKKLMTHDEWRTKDDGHVSITIAHSEHFLLKWAKNSFGKKCRLTNSPKCGANFVQLLCAQCFVYISLIWRPLWPWPAFSETLILSSQTTTFPGDDKNSLHGIPPDDNFFSVTRPQSAGQPDCFIRWSFTTC